MKLDENSLRNQEIILGFLWGRQDYKQTQEILRDFGDYIEEPIDKHEDQK